MNTFYIPTPENQEKKANLTELLSSLEKSFKIRVGEAFLVTTDNEALRPLLEELAEPDIKGGSRGAAEPRKRKDSPEVIPMGRGKVSLRNCKWCQKEFIPQRAASEFCSRKCAQLFNGEKKRQREFKVVETGRMLSAKELKGALEAGELTTGTRVQNIRTGDVLISAFKTDKDAAFFELQPMPLDA